MTRAFTPPETLSKEDIRAIADVRRDIWKNAFLGMFTGGLSGMVLHSAAVWSQKRIPAPPSTTTTTATKETATATVKQLLRTTPLNRNTAVLAVLGGSALGSYVMAVTTGKNEVHNLHPVFEVGSKQWEEAQQQKQLEEEDQQRHRNRLIRKESLKQTIQQGKGGLSDSHGGHWEEDHSNQRHQNRQVRRVAMKDTIEHGHGISDSHGGKWK
mmetsp:Transcript_20318/g.26655  ORF Transcript_20318/g.26655 Transcript_20318/m.26655 type:complete len:212 (+) Transcript_20318:50-685(+)|eukprot:CAMPEP_0195265804 /NCGR_PEP_ID=MMETSP0706-20130129/11643_1 /TAXON_ID=33640 /ORGANISM="Asterionellopsis glacialis, Strain CCMP134" /LENGTH=211 /DNA_ID=CAMNT_0040320295 /DNA_START=27 /DNA_END=662 /DNA_ORIENTATION=+